jgi:hypothetical protein
MKSKTLLPLILWLVILPWTSYGQTPPESPGGQNNGYGIEPETLYPGSMILELLEAAEAEIDIAVEEAYSEGYKAAALRFAPEIELLKAQVEASQKQRTASVKDRLLFGLGGFALGALSIGIYNLVPK